MAIPGFGCGGGGSIAAACGRGSGGVLVGLRQGGVWGMMALTDSCGTGAAIARWWDAFRARWGS